MNPPTAEPEQGRYARLSPIAELKRAAAGHWPDILLALAPELSVALGNAPEHVSCPRHGGENGFRFFDDYEQKGGAVCNTCGFFSDGLLLLSWLRGWPIERALDEVQRWLGQPRTARAPRPAPAPARVRDYARAQAEINRVWRASLPLAGTPAERYLERRGIWRSNHSPVLRFHPGLAYFAKQEGKLKRLGDFPCLIAPIQDARGALVSLHRIYLTEAGDKAPVPEPKRMMMRAVPELSGSAVRLFQPTHVLGLAEGIETALAARAVARIPVWSALNAVLLERVKLPRVVRHVVIWADKDQSYRGHAAAERASELFIAEGRTVEVVMPTQPVGESDKGLDWLDVLVRYGMEGFPVRWRNWRARPEPDGASPSARS